MTISTDVSTTKRKKLSPSQRLALYEAFGGKCCLCDLPIKKGDAWIDEHLIALGLGGTNKWDNRGPAHVLCASKKTKTDVKMIAKAKRQKRKALGIKKETAQIPQRPKLEPPPKPGKIAKEKLPPLPRPSLYR